MFKSIKTDFKLEIRYKTNVVPRRFQVEDLILRKAQLIQIDNKLAPKWTGPYRVKEVLGGSIQVGNIGWQGDTTNMECNKFTILF